MYCTAGSPIWKRALPGELCSSLASRCMSLISDPVSRPSHLASAGAASTSSKSPAICTALRQADECGFGPCSIMGGRRTTKYCRAAGSDFASLRSCTAASSVVFSDSNFSKSSPTVGLLCASVREPPRAYHFLADGYRLHPQEFNHGTLLCRL